MTSEPDHVGGGASADVAAHPVADAAAAGEEREGEEREAARTRPARRAVESGGAATVVGVAPTETDGPARTRARVRGLEARRCARVERRVRGEGVGVPLQVLPLAREVARGGVALVRVLREAALDRPSARAPAGAARESRAARAPRG